MKIYHVKATWDPEAGVWVATSDDVPGLITEASSQSELLEKLRVLVPELLELNHALPEDNGAPQEVPIELITYQQEKIRLRQFG